MNGRPSGTPISIPGTRVGRGANVVDLVLSDGADWMERGLCAQTDPDMFHPEKGTGSQAAQRVCASGCEVRRECLEYALARNEQHGVWGGLSANQRRRLKARRTA